MIEVDLHRLERRVDDFRAEKHPSRHKVFRAGVAMILQQREQDVDVLMIRRADRSGDPWSGHMAFPGGRMQPEDANCLATAQRETREEIGLDLEQNGQVIGRLSDIYSRAHDETRKMVVTPYLYRLDSQPALQFNHEVKHAIWLPLSFIGDHSNRKTMQYRDKDEEIALPKYEYDNNTIWGMSLRMLDELVSIIAVDVK